MKMVIYFITVYFIHVVTSQMMPTTTDSSSSTTWEPWPNWPPFCTDECDTFGVRIVDYYQYDEDIICLTYQTKRFFDAYDGYECGGRLKYVVLGVCSYDSENIEIDSTDLNGLIESCEVYPEPHSHSHSHSHSSSSSSSSDDTDTSSSSSSSSMDASGGSKSSSSSGSKRSKGAKRGKGPGKGKGGRRQCHGVDNDEFTGILVKLPPGDHDNTIEICLRNVFVEEDPMYHDIYPGPVSENVGFRKRYDRYSCDDDWVTGLPCIDEDVFESGAYDYMGFNYGSNYGNYYRKQMGRDDSDSAAEWHAQWVDGNVMHSVLPHVKWEILSGSVLGCLCLIGICTYIYLLKRKRKGTSGHEAVNTNDETDVESENDENGEGDENGENTKVFLQTKYQAVISEENDGI